MADSFSSSRVRQNAGSCAIAAALMIYFGFFYGLTEPSGTDLFSRANWVFFHTLRIGGIAMGVLALWSLSGQRFALIVDAIVSIAIGALLAATGVVMLIDGGGTLQSVLNVMFGWMFVSSGRRNWSDYYALADRAEHTARPMVTPPHIQPPSPQATQPRAATATTVPLAVEEFKPKAPEPKPEPTPDDDPGGFLESFADEGPPPTP